MLAYSSIAHAGYALVGVVAAMRLRTAASPACSFYMLALHGLDGRRVRRADPVRSPRRRSGQLRRSRRASAAGIPAAALAFSFFLLSLAGVPPTAGFFGKLYVFSAAVDAELYVLAVIGLLNSVIGAYYYLRVWCTCTCASPRRVRRSRRR